MNAVLDLHYPEDTRALQALDRQHHLHPFTDHHALRQSGTRLFVRGQGIYLYDDTGKRWLDAMSGLWCVTLGYGRREMAETAARQVEQLSYCSSFFQGTHPLAIELAQAIAAVAPPGLGRVFFVNSGSEANDTAVRMARRYWQIEGRGQRQLVISRRNAYHGSTLAGASLGGFACMHEQGGLPLPGFLHVAQPYWYADGQHMDREAFGLEAARSLEQKILAVGPDRVAAFVAEPIQGAGGVVIPPASYWPEVMRILRRYDVLLVADEVICGFGRTGAWFGSDALGLQPDLMTVSKGLSSGYAPIGATIVGRRVGDALVAAPGEFEHGFTCSGHPLGCALALKTLEILQRERVIERVARESGPQFARLLAALGDDACVGEVRSMGLMGAIELRDPHARGAMPQPLGNLFRGLCAGLDLIVRAEGDTILLAPPLVMTGAELDDMGERLRMALRRLPQALADERRRSDQCA